jgi:Tfp pilus assembly protein PilP
MVGREFFSNGLNLVGSDHGQASTIHSYAQTDNRREDNTITQEYQHQPFKPMRYRFPHPAHLPFPMKEKINKNRLKAENETYRLRAHPVRN